MTAPTGQRLLATPSLGPDTFRAAMASFPTGVTVVTTLDADGRPAGFTANSFCSVSLDPPLVLVCLATTAFSYPVFASCDHFGISILGAAAADTARRFATAGADKFSTDCFDQTSAGVPVLSEALCVLGCSTRSTQLAGDHVILLGRVEEARVRDGDPLIFFKGFQRLRDEGRA